MQKDRVYNMKSYNIQVDRETKRNIKIHINDYARIGRYTDIQTVELTQNLIELTEPRLQKHRRFISDER